MNHLTELTKLKNALVKEGMYYCPTCPRCGATGLEHIIYFPSTNRHKCDKCGKLFGKDLALEREENPEKRLKNIRENNLIERAIKITQDNHVKGGD